MPTPSTSSSMFNLIKAIWLILLLLLIPVVLGASYILWSGDSKLLGGQSSAVNMTSSATSTKIPFAIELIWPVADVKYIRSQFYLRSNERVGKFQLPEGWKSYAQAEGDIEAPQYDYIVETNKLKPGEQAYEIVATSGAGEQLTLPISFVARAKLVRATFWSESSFEFAPDALTAIANKHFRLPMYYKPADLVKVEEYGVKAYNSAQIREAAIEQLVEMTEAISKAKIDYHVTSGFRGYGAQVDAYNYWLDLSNGDVAYTDSFSARPGHSEHQLGTTIDFLTKENGESFFKFEDTKLSKWLAKNAHRYGFVKSYPNGKQAITGYKFEPWHYRYVGVENALSLKESGLTLTEWLYEQNGIEIETL